MSTSYQHNRVILKSFRTHLIASGVSYSTQKNYISDVSKFLTWFGKGSTERIDSALGMLKRLEPTAALAYKDKLVAERVPVKSINRSLSSLRRFGRYLAEHNILDFDFASDLTNIDKAFASPSRDTNDPKIVSSYKLHLANTGVSRNTLKNYTSDVRHFVNWIEHNDKSLASSDPELVRAYIEAIRLQYPPSSAKRKSAAISKFLDWAKEKDLVDINPISETPLKIDLVRPIFERLPKNNAVPEIIFPPVAMSLPEFESTLPLPPKKSYKAYYGTLLLMLFLTLGAGALLLPIKHQENTQEVLSDSDTRISELQSDLQTENVSAKSVILTGDSPTISSDGSVKIDSREIVLTTKAANAGNITLAPGGQGKVTMRLSNISDSSFDVNNANLDDGVLIKGTVGNNLDSFYLLKLESGSPVVTRFSVDASGNVYAAGSINLGGDIATSGIPRLSRAGKLVNISGYSQESGNFAITQTENDQAAISKASETQAKSDLLTLSLSENENGNADTLVLKRLGAGDDGFALFVDEGNVRFDGELVLGNFSSNPNAVGEGTIIYNNSDHNAYLWNGNSWQPIANSPNTLWKSIGGITTTQSTDEDLSIGGVDANSPFYVNSDGSFAAGINTFKVDNLTKKVGVGVTNPMSKFEVAGEAGGNALASFNQTSGDDIIVASASGNTRFRVAATGSTFIDLNGSGSGNALCHSGTGTEDQEIVDCTANPTADYMEIYPTTISADLTLPKQGDIVAVTDEYAITQDGDKVAKLSKTINPFQINSIGIVSDKSKAGDFNSVGHNINSIDNPQPIALAGRVPVNMNQSSEALEPGDYVTSSDSPGLGMKATRAGFVIGKALESWKPGQTTVMVFVGNSYINPSSPSDTSTADELKTAAKEIAQNANDAIKSIQEAGREFSDTLKRGVDTLAARSLETSVISPLAGSADVSIRLGKAGALTIKDKDGTAAAEIDSEGNAGFAGELSAKGLKTGKATVDELFAQNIYTDTIISKDGTKTLTLEALEDTLRQVSDEQSKIASTLSNFTIGATDSDAETKHFSTLSANEIYSGLVAAESVSSARSLGVGTDFIIQSDENTHINSIDTLSAPLSIQSLALSPIYIMAGKVQIDKEGNTTITGSLNVLGQITTPALSLQRPIIAQGGTSPEPVTGDVIETNAIAGHAVLPADKPEITIKNENVTSRTLIYVSPAAPTRNQVLYVKEKDDGYFKIGFDKALDTDVEFNWWVIDLSEVRP